MRRIKKNNLNFELTYIEDSSFHIFNECAIPAAYTQVLKNSFPKGINVFEIRFSHIFRKKNIV